ncbi:VTT domain-containing protein [Asticcacaulis sp. EMRT-3]|uniref:TVP38/TMEM64 family protein n=1 Tax=Asticcacaulis sp. EMRT-3 TaxID=3040349 RepID=UPI0024AFD14C|nr:VTT domain-containing protein [Asticcacaulis sp. EMRT-3]MDI7775213.1 VTT domain-containing protein [Asticcacaulis sp. EMRT-3]
MHNKLQHIWRRVTSFFVNLDARAVRAVWASLLLLALMAVVFLIGKSPWGQAVTQDLEHWMATYRHSPLAVLIVSLVFCVSALFGAPQFVLIAACVVAFGPVWGFVYSWVATLISAVVTFYMGRFAGQGLLTKWGGKRLDRLSSYLGRNAFTASFIVRNIPSAPFIVVNMAFGASRASFPGFLAGCALGVLPKTALVTLFGSSYSSLQKGGDWKMALVMAGLAVVWLGVMLAARKVYERGRHRAEQGKRP